MNDSHSVRIVAVSKVLNSIPVRLPFDGANSMYVWRAAWRIVDSKYKKGKNFTLTERRHAVMKVAVGDLGSVSTKRMSIPLASSIFGPAECMIKRDLVALRTEFQSPQTRT